MGFLRDNFIADFFISALNFINGLVGSYGWSIIILTTLFRLVLLPLDIRQKKTTRKQQELQPKIDAINKKYSNDKEMQSRKTMELYKKEGFNPMSGCLPLLLQMPIFFAFFGALQTIAGEQIAAMFEAVKNTVEPMQNFQFEGWLWVRNLWQPDTFLASVVPDLQKLVQYPFFKEMAQGDFDAVMGPLKTAYESVRNGWYILPLLAGGMAFLQSKLMAPKRAAAPKKTDGKPNPMSGKTMQYIMPIMSVVICTSSSAAFALYWAMSNIVSVASYLVMDRVFKITRPEEKKENTQQKPAGYLK